MAYKNAVLEDKALQDALSGIHPKFGDLCTRVAGEVWGGPLISQKIKTFITIAVDVVNGNLSGPGTPFEAHVDMALKQGATAAEIEELLLFMCAYAGFNKAAGAFGRFAEIKAKGKTALGTPCK
jgi:alkylhydroperoxidase/carboxymuconolactone decarboxylase family protein YurZ